MSSSAKRQHHRKPRSVHANTKRALRKAIERRMVGLNASQAAGWQVIKLLVDIAKIRDQVNAAFGGEPFLLGFLPDAPPNRQRFRAYVDCQKRAMKLLWEAIELWMLVCGMKKEDNWTPMVAENMRQTIARSMFKIREKNSA